jgi:cytochrome c peroxidase
MRLRATLRLVCLALLIAAMPALAGDQPIDFNTNDPDVKLQGFAKLPRPVDDADYRSTTPEKVELGKFLFFDKILSGNLNISCGTCHHALADTGDGLSLPIGEGGLGLGVTRDTGSGAAAVPERVPRNAPPVFNLGAMEFDTLFHDGRVQVDPSQPSGFLSPAGDDLPMGLENVLAAQAMFPVTSGTEMAGQDGENPIANAAALGDLAGPAGVWEQLAQRLRDIPEYVDLFVAAFDEIDVAADIEYKHAANAIAAFEGEAWRADNSPFDRYLRGDRTAMSVSAQQGMRLFYGEAGCDSCHAGAFQTDQDFHCISMPQIGPGKGDGDGHEDFGRERVTGDADDRFLFRTPTLRNVALTGPWGHAGAFDSLEAVVLHHLDPVASLEAYDTSQAVLPSRPDLDALDFLVHEDAAKRADIAAANELPVVDLTDREIERLMDFLHALTDPSSIDLRADVPKRVPSGLTLAE